MWKTLAPYNRLGAAFNSTRRAWYEKKKNVLAPTISKLTCVAYRKSTIAAHFGSVSDKRVRTTRRDAAALAVSSVTVSQA